jgi:hypothetical protein
MIKDVIIHYLAIRNKMAKSVVKVLSGQSALPELFASDQEAAHRFIEFFTANIRNPHTRRAYARAAVGARHICETNRIFADHRLRH